MHELRTPLAAMVPWAHAVEVIERNTRLQARLIDDLLDVSRMIAGTVRLSKTPIHLVPILEIAIHSIRPEAAAKGVAIESALDGEVGAILADGVRVEQIGGVARAESAGQGRGSTFTTVSLPFTA